MITKIIEATNNDHNWGKFMVMRPDVEWSRKPLISAEHPSEHPLLSICGSTRDHIWVLDLQTGEGINVKPGGLASADLSKHQVWVCPMFEPFLAWLYTQNLADLQALPDVVNLPDAPFELFGHRRAGRSKEL